jgi:hypothetical protein
VPAGIGVNFLSASKPSKSGIQLAFERLFPLRVEALKPGIPLAFERTMGSSPGRDYKEGTRH